MQGQPNGFSVRNIFEGSLTEEVKGSGKDIFVGGFNFVASEARMNFNIPASAYQGVIVE